MKHKHNFLILLLLTISSLSFGQDVLRKKTTALRIDKPLKIDGILDEQEYAKAEKASGFLQIQPYNGQPSYKETEVQIFYDNEAIYFGAMLFDHPDSIASYITTRDNVGGSDYFLVFIDPNNEGLTSYEFLVTPANGQTDLKGAKNGSGDREDSNWDAVWQSATKILDNGWSLEIKIPYSAIRFPFKENPVWGINFFRQIRRFNSNNSWNRIDSKISGFIQQSGELHGLNNIKPPIRLSVTPYIAEYAEIITGEPEPKFLFKGGLDLKYGLSESHTLDMMLIPDFGQIQSDDKELNLSPYELHYSEKRQFFNEGSELFGRGGIFYSRRIGGRPLFSSDANTKLEENEVVKFNPTSTQLVNATKISGRNKNGWGMGFLNAMSLASKAFIEDTLTGYVREIVTQPFTNYNVSVLEKSLANNSFISVINTNLSVIGTPYVSNVTATQFQLKNRKQSYQADGQIGLSYKSEADDKIGYGYDIGLSKIKGSFRYGGRRSSFSKTLDINDLGYLQRNNIVENKADVSYNIHEPFSIFKNYSAKLWYNNTNLYEPNLHIKDQFNFWTDATFKNNLWAGFYAEYSPGETDFFEPRSSNNRYWVGPEYYVAEFDFMTDNNKELSWFVFYGYYDTKFDNRWGDWLYSNLWWKASSRLSLSYELNARSEKNSQGYVHHFNNDSIFFGNYNRNTLENTFGITYNFSTKMGINLRARHYWSVADYLDDLLFLNPNGSLSSTDFKKNSDVNFNAFNIDMSFRWEFSPGSELSLAWKNDISNSNNKMGQKFQDNLKETFVAGQNNNISVKLLYYIDYNMVFKDRANTRNTVRNKG